LAVADPAVYFQEAFDGDWESRWVNSEQKTTWVNSR